jgi:hypothetical protein
MNQAKAVRPRDTSITTIRGRLDDGSIDRLSYGSRRRLRMKLR